MIGGMSASITMIRGGDAPPFNRHRCYDILHRAKITTELMVAVSRYVSGESSNICYYHTMHDQTTSCI